MDMRQRYDALRQKDKAAANQVFDIVADITGHDRAFIYKHLMNISKNQILQKRKSQVELEEKEVKKQPVGVTPAGSAVLPGVTSPQREYMQDYLNNFVFIDLF